MKIEVGLLVECFPKLTQRGVHCRESDVLSRQKLVCGDEQTFVLEPCENLVDGNHLRIKSDSRIHEFEGQEGSHQENQTVG